MQRVTTRRLLIVTGLTVSLTVTFIVVALLFPRELVTLFARFAPSVVFFVETDEPLVALTIDDGPDPRGTPRILDVLEAHGAQATFFLIGSRITDNEALVTRMGAGRHELGNHTYRERASILVPLPELSREIARTHALLSAFGEVRWFRPGSGFFSSAMIRLLGQYGYRCVLADIFTADTWIDSPLIVSWYLLWQVRPGSIIVLHDANGRGERAAATLERILPELQARGYRVVTLSELIRMKSHRKPGATPY